MEHRPHQSTGGEHHPERPTVNSYGTDDPEEQARIEQARIDASQERRHNRARLEQLVEHGMSPDEADALIEFEDALRQQREQTARTARATELAVATAGPEVAAPGHRPRVYVVDPASPEDNKHGQWLDAGQGVNQLQADITAMLANSPNTEATEWAIHACEAFAGLDVTGLTDLDLVVRLAGGVAEHGTAYAVYVQLVGTDDRDQLEKFDDVYVGSFDSPEAWARAVGDDLEWGTHLDEVVDPMLRPYLTIDYARFARESRASWDVVQGIDGKTHVFMR